MQNGTTISQESEQLHPAVRRQNGSTVSQEPKQCIQLSKLGNTIKNRTLQQFKTQHAAQIQPTQPCFAPVSELHQFHVTKHDNRQVQTHSNFNCIILFSPVMASHDFRFFKNCPKSFLLILQTTVIFCLPIVCVFCFFVTRDSYRCIYNFFLKGLASPAFVTTARQ